MAVSFPGIPAVSSDDKLADTVRALVETVELQTGQRGQGVLQSITKKEFDALIDRLRALGIGV
jgi:hypothetical protein